MNVVVDNLLTHYEVQGSGPTILLLHGWGDNLRGLAGLQQTLATNFRVISLDLPGFGATQTPPAAWNLDNFAAFTADFLTKINEQPTAIVGHSNGGAIAIRGLATNVLSAQQLVLMAASGIRTSHGLRRKTLQIFAKLGSAATIWLPGAVRVKLRRKLYGVAGSDLLFMENMQETFKKTVRQDVQADAAVLKLPTLLIYAAQDKAVPVKDGATYQKLITGSRLEIIDGAGHFVHLDAPEKVADLIKDFVK